MPIRVVLIDPQHLVREGLALITRASPDVHVVGEAVDARTGYIAVDQLRPDVVVIELTLPGIDGAHATREILRRLPTARVLVLTTLDGDVDVARALGFGALGYALKTQSGEEVLGAIRAVARGEAYFAPGTTPRSTPPASGTPDVPLPIASLSSREREIFSLIVRGLTTEAIARELSISTKTVETHRCHINTKLGLHSTADIVRFAAMHGLLTPFTQRVEHAPRSRKAT